MNLDKIYPLFLKKIENRTKNQVLKIFKEDTISNKEEMFRVIISFEDISRRDNFILKHKNLEILNKFDLIPAINLNLTKQQILSLKNNNLIKRIEENQKLYLSLHDIIEIIGLNKYRKSQFSCKGKNIIIGIIDNGINQDFDTISDVVLTHYPQTKSLEKQKEKNRKGLISHGTLMANIISNQYVNDKDYTIGIAPEAKLIDFNISNSEEKYYFSNILEIFDFIIKNKVYVDILLISLTTLHPSDSQDILSLACNLLVDKGIIVVCPAGNFGPESYTIGSPSAAEKVITIGALTKDMTISYYSGRGPTLNEKLKPDFCLPGSKIEIPLSHKLRVNFSGTSAAAGIGAGIIALIKEYNPDLSHIDILEIIKNSSIDLNYQKISQGFGTTNIINIFKYLDMYQEGRILPYNYIIKRSLWFTIEFIVILIIVFYLIFFFNLMKFFYNIF